MPVDQLVEQPSNTTESPYIALPLSSTESSSNIKLNRHESSNFQVGGPIKRQIKTKSTDDQDCWFCLTNPKCEKHLVVYVGEHNYIVLAKGGLVPHHLLIVPILHYANSQDLPLQVTQEILLLKKILKNVFKREGSGILFYERNYASRHLQIQIVPVPSGNPESLLNAFICHGKKMNIKFKDISSTDDSLKLNVTGNDRYFYVEFEDNRKLLHIIDGKFPMYFGRDVLASKEILSLPVYRIDWKKCVLSEQDEKTVVDDIKKKFKICKSLINN